MRIILLLISNGLIIGGAGLLGLTLVPINQLISQLPIGALKQRWKGLRILISFCIYGYIAYAIFSWNVSYGMAALIVPIIFFAGATFALVVSKLALQTAFDVKKMADLECENITDPLTGTHNRRHLDRCLVNEVDRARRYWLPLSIMMFDIDHFKKVNDNYGHQVGDKVLIHIGRLLLEQVRNTDTVARYGGEEFVIITPHTRLPDAQDLAERIRLKVEATPILLKDVATNGDALKVTVSVGVAAVFEGVADSKALISLADDALYIAKKSGRNRVVACDHQTQKMPESSISCVAVSSQ